MRSNIKCQIIEKVFILKITVINVLVQKDLIKVQNLDNNLIVGKDHNAHHVHHVNVGNAVNVHHGNVKEGKNQDIVIQTTIIGGYLFYYSSLDVKIKY